MRPGSGGTSTVRTAGRIASGLRRFTAVAVATGVLAWALLPAFSFPIDSDTGSTTCRMACADTPDCCCKPTAAREPKNDHTPGAELSTPATTRSCPRDCATLTVVPGTSTARKATGVHRVGAPGTAHTAHSVEAHVAIQQELLEVAQPRGPPAQDLDDRSSTRVSPNTPGACAPTLGEFPQKTQAGSGSPESGPSSARNSIRQSVSAFEPSLIVRQQEPHSASEARGRNGANAQQYGGPHE